MSRRRFDEAPGPSEAVPGATSSVLVSLHYLRSALRRRWRVWVGAGVVGFLLGIAATVVVPASSAGRTTVFLEHDATVEPSLAMATDLNLLQTRTVAARTIDELGLDMTPEDFQATIKAEPLTSDLMVISVYAADDATAKLRAKTLTEVFMDFRADQIVAQSDALVEGYQDRVDTLQRQSDRFMKQYEVVSATPDSGSQAADLLTQRTQTDEQIGQLQQQIADAQLQSASIVQASQVVDEASLVPRHPRRRTALAGLSGMVGGVAVGMGFVLAVAITSDRLRRREDVSRALGVPVRIGVGEITASRWAPWHGRRARHATTLLVHSLEHALDHLPTRPLRVALAAVDNVDDTVALVAALGVDLHRRGTAVLLVDLSRAGVLEDAVERRAAAEERRVSQQHQAAEQEAEELLRTAVALEEEALADGTIRRTDNGLATALRLRSHAEREAEELLQTAVDLEEDAARSDGVVSPAQAAPGPVVFRSESAAQLARGPLDGAGDLPAGDRRRAAWDDAEITLTLVETVPDGGLESLASWADLAIPVVTTGRSSAERLRTTTELVRAAGLQLPFAVMVGCDPTDESIGREGASDEPPGVERRTG
ncbi:hypothetical protein CLV56_1079 [Mumia flava]|uniref:Subunit length determinant protein n=1 Tax=Mumia flava TaxID=1348852 RepID=A0A0B2B232_9ACTN|nr:hypothetical protein [Mumia flava]PJJ56865.1 hypothetical protein CLV56_1079 [Mumia flava]